MKPTLFVVVMMLVGCARPAEPTSSTAANPAESSASSSTGCPMMIPGATATAADTDQGVAITFTTGPDGVVALRARVRRMAEQHGGLMAGCPCRAMVGDGGAPMQGMMRRPMGDAGMPMQGMMMMQGMRMPPADARAEDVDGGARLTLTAKDSGGRSRASYSRQDARRAHDGWWLSDDVAGAREALPSRTMVPA